MHALILPAVLFGALAGFFDALCEEMPMAERARSECQQCGQVDDHPKQNIMRAVVDGDGIQVMGVDTFHHDCLSARDEQMLRDAAQVKGSGPKSSAIIDACKKGARGEKLLALIEGGKLPQAEGLVHQLSEQEEASQND